LSAAEIQRYLEARVAAGDFPGFSWRVAEGERVIAEGFGGSAMIEPRVVPVESGTIWDLASLTKPFVTAALAVQLTRAGLYDLNTPLSGLFPDLPQDKARLTLTHLLTHTSGFPDWAPFYLMIPGKAQLYEALCGMPLNSPPGEKIVYSDLGYLLAGLALEKLTGQGLSDLFDAQFARPLNLRDTGFNPPFTAKRRIAASEQDSVCERQKCAADPRWSVAAAAFPWREGVIWGEVHDGNAHHLGGVAGHAGLFGTVAELNRLAAHLVQGIWRAPFLEKIADDGANRRSLATVLATTAESAAAGVLPGTAAGHAGFTGVSWHYDPESDRHYFLMTNRTHPAIRLMETTALRRDFLRLGAALPAASVAAGTGKAG
jgi:CubicO group peptidase (beta-lactamase class C family)